MIVIIRSLKLTNFKGIANRTILFNDELTSIYGRNRAGKTTIADAYRWLLTGKNMNDDKEFSIKTLDAENVPMHKAEHSVEGEIYEDGIRIDLKRVYLEKWERKTGNPEPEFTGHKTEFYYNNIKVSQTDYNAKVAGIIKDDLLKLLSDPYYFNSLDWQVRRESLFQLAGHITDNDIAAGRPEFEKLLAHHKDFKLHERELNAQRRILNEQLKDIAPRINELTKQNETLQPDSANAQTLAELITKSTTRVTEIDQLLADANKSREDDNKAVVDMNREVLTLKGKLSTLEFQKKQEYQKALNDKKADNNGLVGKVDIARRKVQNIEASIRQLKSDILNLENTILTLQTRQKDYKVIYDEVSEKWEKENAKTFVIDPAAEFNCPTCKQRLPESNIEAKQAQMEKDFNAEKLRVIGEITAKGKHADAVINECITSIKNAQEILKANQEDLTKHMESLTAAQAELDALKAEYDAYVAKNNEAPAPFDIDAFKASPEYNAIITEIEVKETAIKTRPGFGGADPALAEERKSLISEMDIAKRKQSINENITRNTTRIAELQQNEKDLSQELVNVEHEIHILESFIRLKTDTIVSTINDKFVGVQFKMYETQVNGTESPCCITLVNGVPFSDTNTADQINSGLSIINTFSQHYDVYAPIFIDQAEAVNVLMPTASQMVRLVVSTDEELVIQ